jgi:DNA polymerase-3 subunit alpha
MEFKVSNVEYLQTIKDKAIDRITISVITDHEKMDEQVVEELNNIIGECPGNTKLFFQLRDSAGKHHVLLRSQSRMVDVRHQLIDFIEDNPALDYKIN